MIGGFYVNLRALDRVEHVPKSMKNKCVWTT